MNHTVLPSTNGSKFPPTAAWKQQSVRLFFATFNWDNHPPETQALLTVSQASDNALLSLKLKVRDFFGAVNWEGSAIALPTFEAPATETADDIFTLEDFSNLF